MDFCSEVCFLREAPGALPGKRSSSPFLLLHTPPPTQPHDRFLLHEPPTPGFEIHKRRKRTSRGGGGGARLRHSHAWLSGSGPAWLEEGKLCVRLWFFFFCRTFDCCPTRPDRPELPAASGGFRTGSLGSRPHTPHSLPLKKKKNSNKKKRGWGYGAGALQAQDVKSVAPAGAAATKAEEARATTRLWESDLGSSAPKIVSSSGGERGKKKYMPGNRLGLLFFPPLLFLTIARAL